MDSQNLGTRYGFYSDPRFLLAQQPGLEGIRTGGPIGTLVFVARNRLIMFSVASMVEPHSPGKRHRNRAVITIESRIEFSPVVKQARNRQKPCQMGTRVIAVKLAPCIGGTIQLRRVKRKLDASRIKSNMAA
jgi:hypothetical protein